LVKAKGKVIRLNNHIKRLIKLGSPKLRLSNLKIPKLKLKFLRAELREVEAKLRLIKFKRFKLVRTKLRIIKLRYSVRLSKLKLLKLKLDKLRIILKLSNLSLGNFKAGRVKLGKLNLSSSVVTELNLNNLHFNELDLMNLRVKLYTKLTILKTNSVIALKSKLAKALKRENSVKGRLTKEKSFINKNRLKLAKGKVSIPADSEVIFRTKSDLLQPSADITNSADKLFTEKKKSD